MYLNQPHLPLRLTQRGTALPVLMLGDLDITRYVAADGLRIEYARMPESVPIVTLTFAPGCLDLDFDVDLLENLLAQAKAKAAG